MLYFFPFAVIIFAVIFMRIMSAKYKPYSAHIDIGMIFIIVCAIYGLVPALGVILSESGIGYIQDNRMIGYFDLESIYYVQRLFLSFFICFGCSYCFFRNKSDFNKQGVLVNQQHLSVMITIYIMFLLSVPTIKYLLGVDFSEDYIGTYIELRNYPIIIQQIFGVIDQLTFSLMIAIVVCVLRYRPQWGRYLFFALIINLLYASVSGGSRTTAFLGFIAYVVAASILVKPVSFLRLLPIGVFVLIIFMAAGYWRGNTGEDPVLTAIQGGEFMALFVNSVDLSEQILGGEAASFVGRFVFADVTRMIPSQLLYSDKLDPATWYASTLYSDYYAAGGGFAFGALSEAVMGYGIVDAMLRGLLLGWIFAVAGNKLMGRNATIFSTFFYVWLVVICYQSYRDTTFSFLSRGIYQIIPIFVILKIIESNSSKAHYVQKYPTHGMNN